MPGYVIGSGRKGFKAREARQEPRHGHVLDLHDIEVVAGALIAAARSDIAHEDSLCSGRMGSCMRGGHLCAVCYRPIWDCGRAFLTNLAGALGDYPAGELSNLLEAADDAAQRD